MRASISIATALLLLQSCTFDPAVELAERPTETSMLPTGLVSQSGAIGGNSGSDFGPLYCPAGSVIVGFDSDFYLAGDMGAGFCELNAMCASLTINDIGVTRSEVLASTEMPLGDCEPNRVLIGPMLCPGDQVVVGFAAVRSGLYGAITELELHCGAIDTTGFIFNRAYGETWGQIVGSPGSRQIADCENPAVAVGIYGKAGITIDRLGLLCRALAPESQSNIPAPGS